MPTAVAFQVAGNGTPAFIDGAQQQPLCDRYGNQRVVEYRGKYAEANSRGALFHYSTLVAGVTLPIFTNTAQTYGLMNPAGSNVVLELVSTEFTYLSGTQVPGGLVWVQAPSPTANIATGSGGITVATATLGTSGQTGGSGANAKCSTLTAITSVAPTVIRYALGLSAYTMPATNATQGLTLTRYDYDGKILIYPNQILLLGCTVAAAAGVNVVNTIALELPWTAN